MTSPLIIVLRAVAGLLRVTGEDAFAYLQSQFSNDLRRPASESPVTYGLWLTRKGKVAADSLVIRLAADDFLLLSFHTPAESLAEKVLENVIADDVSAEPVACGGVTVAGAGAKAAVAASGLPVPVSGTWLAKDGLIVVASRRGGDSYEIVSTDSAVFAAFSERVQNSMTSGGVAALEALRVASGIPRVPEDCGPGDLPQEAGLDADAVNFTKGCYLGQEVMARLQSQGRANRGLARVTFPAGVVPERLAKLFAGESEAGEIRSGANIGGVYTAMAMVRLRVADGVDSFSTTPSGEPAVARIPAP